MLRPFRRHFRSLAALTAFAFVACASPRPQKPPIAPTFAHQPLLHLLNPDTLDLILYDDGEVSGRDLRNARRSTVKFGQLSTKVADALRAETLRVPGSLPLTAVGGDGKALCEEAQTVIYGVYLANGQEVVFRKSQNCREYVARPRDSHLGETLFRFSEILRGWEAAAASPHLEN